MIKKYCSPTIIVHQPFTIMLYLFNTTIMPNEGIFVNQKVSLLEARNIIHNEVEYLGNPFTSALGHQGSADAFNALFPNLGAQVNRVPASMQCGDEAIALKVLGRLPEGQILTFEELTQIGFEFFRIKMIANNITELESEAAGCGAMSNTGHIFTHAKTTI